MRAPHTLRRNLGVAGLMVVSSLALACAADPAGGGSPRDPHDPALRLDSVGAHFGLTLTVAVLADGSLVVPGTSVAGPSTGALALLRVTPDGALDGGFGSGGIAVSPVPGGAAGLYGVAELADGRLMAVGATHGLDSQPLVARYHADGTLDESFGDAGIRLYDPALFSYYFYGAVRTGSRVLVASWGGKVVALDVDGNLDPTFGDQGVATPMVSPLRLAVQPDGKVLVVGRHGQQFALARLEGDGTPDPAFGTSGMVTVDPDGSDASLGGVAVQPDGKIVVSGQVYAGGWKYVVLRFDADGSPDPTFGIAGKATISSTGHAESALVLPDGRVLVGGPSVVGFGADGTLDESLFLSYMDGDDLALLPDGRVVAVGTFANAVLVWYLDLGT